MPLFRKLLSVPKAASVGKKKSSGVKLAPPGQQAYTTAGTYSWVAPTDVNSVSVVAVGGGGASGYVCSCAQRPGNGGSGGGLGYKNNYTVIPGNSYSVVVGAGGISGCGSPSYFVSACVVRGGGGRNDCQGGSPGGTYTGDGGGNGGKGGGGANAQNPYCLGGGGGGAGGYTGAGGYGGPNSIPYPLGAFKGASGDTGGAGAGGGGGGGGSSGYLAGTCKAGAGGGGVGILGAGSSGAGGTFANSPTSPAPAGAGGSGGANGVGGSGTTGGAGGAYGGGGGSYTNTYTRSTGGGGAVRIIWPAQTRSFPSTSTGDL